jgi:hypothetical protein
MVTYVAPGVATDDGFTGASYLGYAWTDSPSQVVYAYSDELGLVSVGTSLYGPSLAVDEIPYDYHHFYIAWTGEDSQLRYGFLDPPGTYSGAASQYGPALAGLSGRLDAARAGTDNRLGALDPANGIRPFGGPVTVTGQGAPSPAAAGDLSLARADRGDQTRVGDLKERAARNPGGFGHNSPGLAGAAAGTRGIAWAGTGDGSGPFGGDLNDEAA